MPDKPHRKGVFALVGALAVICVGDAAAKTFEPTRKDDPVPNGCKPNNCSLREALLAGGLRTGADSVLLKAGTYRIELPPAPDGGDFTMGSGDTLRGRGAARTTIDGKDVHRVFDIVGDGQRIERLTVTGGKTGPSEFGAGINVCCGTGRVMLKSVVIRDNEAREGPGVHSSHGNLVILDSVIKDNIATGDGGGVFVGPGFTGTGPSRLTIKHSRIIGNDAAVGGGIAANGAPSGNFNEEPFVTVVSSTIDDNEAGYGGGIQSNAERLTIRKSTVSGNTATEGGGLDLRPGPALPQTAIQASTVSGNTATGKGGGILADGNPFGGSDYPDEPQLDMINSTVADNMTNGDAGGIMGDNEAVIDVDNSSIGFNIANDDESGAAVAGGVYQHSNANFSIDDSIIAHNVTLGTMGTDSDCSATQVFSGAGNVISSVFDDGCDASFTVPFNVYTASQIAENVADNGGPTETMALTPTSDAIGFANACPRRDQRGALRPANCDSGAFENRPKHR